ncbi:hypothetical protein ELQ39_14510 [Streptomyces sp. GB4-14]|uniref:tyrosine-type recombinase/integrase n=1 Tax=Streptomyces sp. GB4-14 TaxID=2498703 RepID=UPI003FD4068A|nr:hypothetical protein [Streptomyces sp. GB4-14]
MCGKRRTAIPTASDGLAVRQGTTRRFFTGCFRRSHTVAPGIERVHDTRHTCASLLAALDVHPRIAMQILRHSEIAVTMEYTHVPSASSVRHWAAALRRSSRSGRTRTAVQSHSGCWTPPTSMLLYARQRPLTEVRKWPLTSVGVAGFEPTTSSSRSN